MPRDGVVFAVERPVPHAQGDEATIVTILRKKTDGARPSVASIAPAHRNAMGRVFVARAATYVPASISVTAHVLMKAMAMRSSTSVRANAIDATRTVAGSTSASGQAPDANDRAYAALRLGTIAAARRPTMTAAYQSAMGSSAVIFPGATYGNTGTSEPARKA